MIIQLVDDEDYTREAHDIEQQLRVIRRGITFPIENHLVQPNVSDSVVRKSSDCGMFPLVIPLWILTFVSSFALRIFSSLFVSLTSRHR